MKCQFCDRVIPEDSEFCLFCGKQISIVPTSSLPDTNIDEMNPTANKLESHPFSCDNIAQTPKIKPRFCKHCGNLVDMDTHACVSCGKKIMVFNVNKFTIILLSILVVITISFLVFQQINFKRIDEQNNQEVLIKQSQIENISSDNEKKDSTITSLNEQLTEYKDQLVDYKKDSDLLNTILNFVRSSDAGFASSKFKASDKIFVIDKYNTQTFFTLTCSFSGYTTIYTDTQGNAANIDFSQDSWAGETTKLNIKPKAVGTTIVTFSNDKNDQTFRILIVVTD